MKFIAIFVLFFSSMSFSQTRPADLLVKRVVVFPLRVEKELQKAADETWWDLREKLTENKRFLIASKNFMEVKDVFQPRRELVPADAIILGRLLDSHALITTVVRDGEVRMQAYETSGGSVLWSSRLAFNPTVPASKQIEELSGRLIQDFMASVPYHGAVVLDGLSGRSFYQESGKTFFRADVGVSPAISTGSPLQVVRLRTQSLKPLFEGGAELEVMAEGRITKIDGPVATVEVNRAKAGFEVSEGDFVRSPDEFARLQKTHALTPQSTSKSIDLAGTQLLLDKQIPLTEKEKQKKPLYTALSFIGNLALFLLVAF